MPAFAPSWLSAVAGIQARTDVGLLFKALISVIVTERGGHTTQSADEMASTTASCRRQATRPSPRASPAAT